MAALRRRAAAWGACALLLLGFLAEAAALCRAGLPELTLPQPAHLTPPSLRLRQAWGWTAPGQPVEAILPPEEDGGEPAVQLAVKTLLQNPTLPNGCEVTSLAMVLQSLGYAVTPAYLAKNHMPQGWIYAVQGVNYADNPAECYVGDPASEYGYYMLAPALAETAKSYLESQGGGCAVQDVSGAGEEELERLLRTGTPVIVWATMEYGEARLGDPWILWKTGEVYRPYTNLHCRVLVGADELCFYVDDPIYGAGQAVLREQFMRGYRALGSQAVTVTRRSHIPQVVEIGTAA